MIASVIGPILVPLATLVASSAIAAVGPVVSPPPPTGAQPTPGTPPAGPTPTLTATRLTRPITLDGKLDEAEWQRARPSDTFTQQYPQEGAAPTDRTVVRVLYDDRVLYIGIDCIQTRTPVVPRLTRRDRVTSADRVTVDISSRSDGLTAFHFGVNAAGVLDDGIYFDENVYSADWDENWQAATFIRADGWSVELMIPFQVLRFAQADTHRWGLQVQRYTELRREWDLWAWRPRSSANFVSTFGVLAGLEGIPPPRPVEARVSGLIRLRHRDDEARGDLAAERDWDFSVGVDAKTHPTQGTTLDLTVNPDFGQVEADQVVLNLSNFEVFYPEKRPFFLEGLDTFSTPKTVLYTRRIGARPADPTVATDETLVDSVGPSRIWAAGKFVGAITPRLSVGALSAVAARSVAGVRLPGGTLVEREAAPLSVYNVLRVRRTFGRAGDLGVLATATNRLERGAGPRATNDAYVGAVDGRWRSPSANYVVSGQLISSLLAEGTARSSRDGIPIQPGVPALGGTVTAAKQGGPHWLGTLTQSVSGRGLDYNDLGYQDRKNDAFTYADLTYRTLEPWWVTTDTATTLAASHRVALDGIRLEDHLRLSTAWTFTSFWAASATTYLHAPYFDDRETGDGTALERAGLVGAEAWMMTDPRRLFTAQFWVQGQYRRSGVQGQAYASVVMRPFSRLDCEVSPSVLYTDGEPRFVAKNEPAGAVPQYFFGRLEARNVGVTVRATVGLLPTLTFQLYSQIFLATKWYTDITQAPMGGARTSVRVSDLQPSTLPATVANPNAEESVLNVNAVLRWEYRLGSLVYLVYTRAQSPELTVSPGAQPRLDAGALRGNRGSADVLMLKASFWWG